MSTVSLDRGKLIIALERATAGFAALASDFLKWADEIEAGYWPEKDVANELREVARKLQTLVD